MSRKIAFFDFDGTITYKDTLLEFIKFSKGKISFWMGFLLNSPALLAFKLKLIPNQRAKEMILRHFFKNTSTSEFERICQLFAGQIPRLIRPPALKEIENLKNAGVQVVIVSASVENWIKPWADTLGVQLIATRMEVKDGRLTGKIAGKNCHGDEKVCRIREEYDLSQFEQIRAYGDSSGDSAMLSLSTTENYRYFKPFR